MEQALITPNIDIKTLEINEGHDTYKCQIQTIKNFLQISLYLENKLKYEGNISLHKIQNQIIIFANYNIKEIYEEINLLNKESFKLIKEDNKNKFIIEFIILRRQYILCIELEDEENMKLSNADLIQQISELKEIIKNKDNQNKLLQEELRKYKPSYDKCDNNSFQNFDIKLKEPIHKLQYHTNCINCSILLNDGRFATCSSDHSIIIFNNKTFKPDLTIKDHNSCVYCIIQLKSGILASCSGDKTIKLFKINGNQYEVIQTLNDYTKSVYNIIELKNEKLVSCSNDPNIIFYFKDNDKYIKDYHFKVEGYSYRMIQTKENEIFYSGYHNNSNYHCFFDLLERKIIQKINKNVYSYNFTMISKDLLAISGNNKKITIMNVNSHNIIREIDLPPYSLTVCMLNENILLTGGDYIIRQWQIEGDNLILKSTKENAHNDSIYSLLKIDNIHVLSGDSKGIIKIW